MGRANASKTGWLEARITVEQKALIERAAAFKGRTVSDFVVQTVQEAAKEVVQQYETLRLNREQSNAFVEILLNPPKPNKALRDAAKAYRERVVSR